MRIIAGRFRGRRLATPRNNRTRPALELMRGALFDMIEADLGNARVLDLFSGTGSLGLEALSRGARTVTFVERARSACTVLRENIRQLQATAQTDVWMVDALRLTRASLAAQARNT
jgi:16S rRNA (guanine966-N2)-methyltransferase